MLACASRSRSVVRARHRRSGLPPPPCEECDTWCKSDDILGPYHDGTLEAWVASSSGCTPQCTSEDVAYPYGNCLSSTGCCSSTGCTCTLSAMIADTYTIADTCNSDCICDAHNFYNEVCSDDGCSDQNCEWLHVTISGAMSDNECICTAEVTNTANEPHTQVTKDVWSSSCRDNSKYLDPVPIFC